MRSFCGFFALKLKVAIKYSFLAVAGRITYVPALEKSQRWDVSVNRHGACLHKQETFA